MKTKPKTPQSSSPLPGPEGTRGRVWGLCPQPYSLWGPGQEDTPLVNGQVGMDRRLPGPGVAAPLPVLRVLLLLPVVDLQQVLLHAVGDLRAQVPDEDTAAEAKERCGRRKNGEYRSRPTLEPPGSPQPRPYSLARKIAPVSSGQVYTLVGSRAP